MKKYLTKGLVLVIIGISVLLFSECLAESRKDALLKDLYDLKMKQGSYLFRHISKCLENSEKAVQFPFIPENRTESEILRKSNRRTRISNVVMDKGFRIVEMICQIWDDSTGVWLNDMKMNYSYDANGHISEMLTQMWEVNIWEDWMKSTYSYDVNGNMTEAIMQNWDGTVWVNTMRDTYIYDNGNMIEDLWQNWDGITWVNYVKWTYIYDANGNMIEELEQNWDGSTWVNTMRDTYIYDNGNMIEELEQNWVGSTWVNSWKYIYTYDAGVLTQELWQNWDGSTWVDNQLLTYSYDANGNMIEDLWQNWDGITWVNYVKWTYIYDANGNMIEELEQDWIGSTWINVEKRTYAYETGIEDNLIYKIEDELCLSNHPNPFNPQTTISYTLPKSGQVSLRIYNVKGQLLETLVDDIQQAGYHSIIWNADDVSSGIYLYSITAGNLTVTKKCVILK